MDSDTKQCCALISLNVCHCIAVLLMILPTFCQVLSAAGKLVASESGDRSQGVRL